MAALITSTEDVNVSLNKCTSSEISDVSAIPFRTLKIKGVKCYYYNVTIIFFQ